MSESFLQGQCKPLVNFKPSHLILPMAVDEHLAYKALVREDLIREDLVREELVDEELVREEFVHDDLVN